VGGPIKPIGPIIVKSGAQLEEKVAAKLLSMRVDREVGLIGRATLRFADKGYTLSSGTEFALGTLMTIKHPNGGPMIDGTITGVSLEQAADNGIPHLVIVVDDAAYKLTRGTNIKAHLNGTFSSVAQEIIGKHGLTPVVDSSPGAIEYQLQAGTDLDYLNAIAERTGFAWWVDGPKTMHVKKLKLAGPAATLKLGEDLESFSVRASGLRPSKLTVNGWNPDTQQKVEGVNTEAPAGVSPDLIKSYVGGGPTAKLKPAEASVSDLPPLTPGEAKALADALYSEWEAAAVIAEGICDATDKLKPGVTVEVKDAGPASGKYLVTAVEHSFDGEGRYVTRFSCGSHRPSGLVDTLGAPPADAGFLISGLVIGVVTDNADPDHAGRVKVKYSGINGEIESPWARVVSLGAGQKRGILFEPEVHDEVLVGFERGDTRRPVVLGGLHSKKNTLPTGSGPQAVDAGKVKYRRITSREDHFIEWGDGPAPTDQHILLLLGGAKKQKLRLGADRFDIELIAGTPATIKAGVAKFEITEAGDINIEANNINIKANMQLNMQSATIASLKGEAEVSVEANGVLNVKSSGMATIQASGPLAVKGMPVGIN
jgi:uncharacterized protein involved in type VI secretion and phage assembly